MYKKIILFIMIVLFAYNVEAKTCGMMDRNECNFKYDDFGNECGVINGYCQIKKSNEDSFTNMSCKIIDIPSGMRKIAVKFAQTNDTRTGIIYQMYTTDDDSSPAFCLDPGKLNSTTYHPVRQLKSNSNWDTKIAITYQWYLNHPGKLEQAQLIMWLIAEKMYNNVSYNEREFYEELASLLRDYYIGGTNSCKQVEDILKNKFNNQDFKCDCYYNRNLNGCSEKNWSKIVRNKIKEITDTEYNSILAGIIGSADAYNREVEISTIINQLKTTPAYGGGSNEYRYSLWIYEPDGGTDKYQRIIGLGICKNMGYICEKRYPDYLNGEYGKDLKNPTTIAKFKADLLDPENVILQSDGTVKCGRTTGKSCNSLLQSNEYLEYGTCDQLKNSIYDSYRVSDCDDSTGKVTYLECGNDTIKCDPEINAKYAACHKKDEYSSNFSMSDAVAGDQKNLACILNNVAYKKYGKTIASKDDNFSNSKYCDVYCWESLFATMPNEPAPAGYIVPGGNYIPTGRLFFWGTDYGKREFANIKVNRICWSKDINYNQFSADWYANEDTIAQEYANYLAREEYNNDTNDDHVKVSDEKCCIGTRTTTSGETKCGMSASQCQQFIGAINGCWQEPEGSGNWCGTKPGEDSCSGSWGKKYKKDSEVTKYVRSSSGNTKTGKSGIAESDCTNSKPSAASLTVSNSSDTLKGYIKSRNDLKNALLACQSTKVINENTIYTHTTTMKLEDKDNLGLCSTRGVCGEKLKLTRVIEKDPEYEMITTDSQPNGGFNVSCTDVGGFNSNNPCDPDFLNYGTEFAKYNTFSWDYHAIESFRYGDFFHFYAQADTDFVANKDYKIEEFDYGVAVANGLIYDMGYGFIPTFMKKYSGHFDLDVTIDNLGSNGHFNTITENETEYKFDKYTCGYDLAKIIVEYCPPSDPNYPCDGITKDGISLIYRIIEMGAGDQKKIFPGNSGNGRNPGSNWATFISSNFDKFKNITTTSKIYGRKPLYSIELSPTLIGEIRRDNNNYRGNNMDPYTSYKNVNGKYKITCEGDNDKTCTSDYISELISKGKITGLLADATPSQRRNLIKKYKATGSVI